VIYLCWSGFAQWSYIAKRALGRRTLHLAVLAALTASRGCSLEKSGIAREELFITSKFMTGATKVVETIKGQLKEVSRFTSFISKQVSKCRFQLKVDYVDLYLM
jgi:diketogulonate reductase-like aldo/keto reductase